MKFVTVDIEVFAYDWVVVFKDYDTKVRAIYHNDNDGVKEYLAQEGIIYIGANIKHYDQFIIKAIALDFTPQECKTLNDFIIKYEGNGWEYQPFNGRYFQIDVCDIFDDMQIGLSLKAIEAHLGMDIEETQVDFDIDRPLTEDELEKTIFYCSYDVDAAERIFDIRKDYFKNKLTLGRVKNIPDAKALYMTNAKLTAAYLDARQPQDDSDEREYRCPENLREEYIPKEVFDFFSRMYDTTISDEELFTGKLNINIGDCQVTLGFGGIHGAIPTYRERSNADENET